MNGINKIIDRILAAAALERDRILADASSDAKDITGSLKDLADTDALEIIARGKEQAQSRIKRSEGASELDSRRMILDTKQKMIDSAFERVRGMLLQLPNNEYAAFLAKLASQAVITGHEEILLNESDLAQYGSVLIEMIHNRTAQRGLPSYITISQEVGHFDGGLIVREGNIETNCTFDAILRMLRDSLVGDVAAILFV